MHNNIWGVPMVDTATGMMTVREVAAELDRSIEQVRRYIREGKLPAQKIGMQWFVDLKDLETLHSGEKTRGQRMAEWLEEVVEFREYLRQTSGLLTEEDFQELMDSNRADLL